MRRTERQQRSVALALALLFAASDSVAKAQTQPTLAASGSKPPILLELFTSEGCSSCPPADALLRKLNGKVSSSGQLLIGLSEHVTYWNRLGWSDPFSSDQFTERQSGYAQRFHLEDVYTPQLVINGNTEVVGSNAPRIERALAAQQSPALDLHITSVQVSGDHLELAYSAAFAPPAKQAELYVAVADDLDQSNVLRGENGGRSLTHVCVARSLTRAGPLQAGAGQRISVTLPSRQGSHPGKQHVVLFVQSAGYGPILGVDAHPIMAR